VLFLIYETLSDFVFQVEYLFP